MYGYEEVKGRPCFIQSDLWTKEKAFIIASRLLPQAFQPFHVAKVSKLKLLLDTTGTVERRSNHDRDGNLSCTSPKRLTTSLQRLPHKTDTAKSQIQWTPKTSWTSSETKNEQMLGPSTLWHPLHTVYLSYMSLSMLLTHLAIIVKSNWTFLQNGWKQINTWVETSTIMNYSEVQWKKMKSLDQNQSSS